MSGLTGAQAAERILHDAGIYDVQVGHISGNLTDHYNPKTKVWSCDPASDRIFSTDIAWKFSTGGKLWLHYGMAVDHYRTVL